jgi:hypothetical protein
MAPRKDVRISLPRRPRARASSRVSLTISMHPHELAALRSRAAAVSMSLTAYVAALLASDAEDVPSISTKNPRINWLEDSSGATIARRCAAVLQEEGAHVRGRRCVLPDGHPGACSAHGPLASPIIAHGASVSELDSERGGRGW